MWACPVCAAKIAERRRVELLGAMTMHKAGGGTVFMLTLTAPHQRVDKLADLLPKHAKALRSFWSRWSVKRVLLEMGVLGQIRAAEVTHGRRSDQNNGWHPHHHVLLFAGAGVGCGEFGGADLKDWACRLYLQWAKCCEAAGLGTPSYAHGLRLDDGSKAASYVAKWGLEDEMTKGHTKKSSKGETPFDFLRAVLADATDKQAGALFVEFAQAFKGKRQLTWSPGLKARFAVGETTDEELAAKTEDSALLLGRITLEEWRLVLKAEGRALVLQLAENGGWDAVERYLVALGCQQVA
ncbi:MAG: Replication protein [Candidatus Accumulibacter phosphatis]|uniref:Replication protein n=1 Tax=Candidatus Accumulibacter phosphatis TaxID=327160 RepID=A0A080M151_9PROT|nr:MAG: Replication protein [Candidatus Accumulibacter phosphatis]